MNCEIFLETDRLIFRRFTEQDAPLLHDLDSDPEVMRYLTGGKPSSLADIVEEALPRLLAFYERFENLGFWAVHEKASGEFVGWFHLAEEELSVRYALTATDFGR